MWETNQRGRRQKAGSTVGMNALPGWGQVVVSAGATGGAGPQEQRGGAGEGMAYGLLCPGQAARQEELRHRGWAVGGRAQRVRGG